MLTILPISNMCLKRSIRSICPGQQTTGSFPGSYRPTGRISPGLETRMVRDCPNGLPTARALDYGVMHLHVSSAGSSLPKAAPDTQRSRYQLLDRIAQEKTASRKP